MNQNLVSDNNMVIAADVAVFNKKGQILLGKRLVQAGYGTWALPGGHVSDKEEILDAAKRELKEELGDSAEINVFNKIVAIRDVSLPPKYVRYITIIFEGEYLGGEVLVNEPGRCEKWEWFDLDKLPEPLFNKIGDVLQKYINNQPAIV